MVARGATRHRAVRHRTHARSDGGGRGELEMWRGSGWRAEQRKRKMLCVCAEGESPDMNRVCVRVSCLDCALLVLCLCVLRWPFTLFLRLAGRRRAPDPPSLGRVFAFPSVRSRTVARHARVTRSLSLATVGGCLAESRRNGAASRWIRLGRLPAGEHVLQG